MVKERGPEKNMRNSEGFETYMFGFAVCPPKARTNMANPRRACTTARAETGGGASTEAVDIKLTLLSCPPTFLLFRFFTSFEIYDCSEHARIWGS